MLRRLLDRAAALEASHERAAAIGRILEQVHELQSAARFDDALALIGAALSEHGYDAALADLKRQLEFEREQQQYAAGLHETLAKARQLMSNGHFADAVAALEASAAEYPGEPEISSLLNLALQAKAAREEDEFSSSVAERIDDFERSRDWRAALDCAEEALKRYPYNAKLFGLLTQARENWRQQQRLENIDHRRAMIEEAITAGDWVRAETGLRTARQEFPGEDTFAGLELRLRQAHQQVELKNLGEQVQRSFARDDLEGAARQLNASQALSGQILWQALDRELQRRRAYQSAIQGAREFDNRATTRLQRNSWSNRFEKTYQMKQPSKCSEPSATGGRPKIGTQPSAVELTRPKHTYATRTSPKL